jgi:hypothetical protein
MRREDEEACANAPKVEVGRKGAFGRRMMRCGAERWGVCWMKRKGRLGEAPNVKSSDGRWGRAGEKAAQSGAKLPRFRVSFHQDTLLRNKLISKLINKLINKLISKLISKLINKLISKLINKLINKYIYI